MTRVDTYAVTTAINEGVDSNKDTRKVDPNEAFLRAILTLIQSSNKTGEFHIEDEMHTALGWYLNKNLPAEIIHLLNRLDMHSLTAVVKYAHRFNVHS